MQVSYVIPVTLAKVEANGAGGTTTELTLTFDRSVAGLTKDHITITNPNNGGAAKMNTEALRGGGTTWTLPVSVSKAGTVRVSVNGNPTV